MNEKSQNSYIANAISRVFYWTVFQWKNNGARFTKCLIAIAWNTMLSGKTANYHTKYRQFLSANLLKHMVKKSTQRINSSFFVVVVVALFATKDVRDWNYEAETVYDPKHSPNACLLWNRYILIVFRVFRTFFLFPQIFIEFYLFYKLSVHCHVSTAINLHMYGSSMVSWDWLLTDIWRIDAENLAVSSKNGPCYFVIHLSCF